MRGLRDKKFATTRRLFREKSVIGNDAGQQFETAFFLPEMEDRGGEGGLRTRRYYKKSLPGQPLVSVITVALNSEKYLEQTVRSVINQTYGNVEYIVIDGGSADKTVEIIQQYERAIDYWVSEPDNGIYDAMNKGIKVCFGEIVGILNSDDFYEPEAVEEVVEVFNNNPDVLLVHGAMKKWDKSGVFAGVSGSKKQQSDLLAAPFHHPACFFHKTFYKYYGLYDQQYYTAADYDLMLRFKQNHLKHLYIDRALTNFRKVGVTSRSSFFPAVQIWNLLKKNNYPFHVRAFAVSYRAFRRGIKFLLDRLTLSLWKRRLGHY